tara:strand:- start:671 stop:781 length:111 start_codon:yes stop_codon:yes gene_type:complete
MVQVEQQVQVVFQQLQVLQELQDQVQHQVQQDLQVL